MENGKMPVYPSQGYIHQQLERGCTQTGNGDFVQFHGLTKREYFAGIAMQGLFSQHGYVLKDLKELSSIAVRCADALLIELEKSE